MYETKLRNKTITAEQNDEELYQQSLEVAECTLRIEMPITCGNCKIKFHLIEMFKCFYCHFYFCEKCAKEHFAIHKDTEKEDQKYGILNNQ